MATVPVPTEAAEAATSAPSPATPAPMQTETPQAANLQTQICYHSLTIRKGNVHRHGPPPKPEGSRNPRAAPKAAGAGGRPNAASTAPTDVPRDCATTPTIRSAEPWSANTTHWVSKP